MGFIQSFIFSRTILGILILACFIVTALDLYIDSSQSRVVSHAALQVADNGVDIISEFSRVYEETKTSADSGMDLIERLNAKLDETPDGMTLQAITATSKKTPFQQDAFETLSKNPNEPFYRLDEGEDSTTLQYAVISPVFASATKSPGIIMHLTIPMGHFQALQHQEANKTLWVLIIFGVVASLMIAFFVGFTRHSADVLAASKEKDLEYQKQLSAGYERFFPHEFLEMLQKQNILDIKLGDQAERKMSVMFADIRNFTTVIEKKSPAESFQFINDYLAVVGPVIREQRGFIDKFIGDSIMALFNKTDDALDAAIKMLSLVRQTALKPENLSKAVTEIGIGLHFGSLMVGTVGEAMRMDGTVISDVVNAASRIEALNKTYGTNIIISDHFLDSLENKLKYKVRFLDQIYVKGKSTSVKLFEVFDVDPPELISKKEQIRDRFQNAVECYKSRKFQDAINIIQDCQKTLPEDRALGIYIDRCNRYISQNLGNDWDPIAKLSQKDNIE